jgi:hypothetical protein
MVMNLIACYHKIKYLYGLDESVILKLCVSYSLYYYSKEGEKKKKVHKMTLENEGESKVLIGKIIKN